jgi:hypothetical protein
MKQPQAGSSKVPLTTVNPDERFGLEPGVPADPLDEIILGVKMGTVDVSDEALVCLTLLSAFAGQSISSAII